MRGVVASCALAAVLLVVAWADHHGDHGHHDHHDHHTLESTCHKLSPANADFGFALYKNLKAKAAGKNVFFSPLGISTALSVLASGAGGETLSQLYSALGYSAYTRTQINEAYAHLFGMLQPMERNLELFLGNAVAVRNNFNLLRTFALQTTNTFNGKTFSVDFARSAEAADEINAYIAEKTNNMITDQVKDLNPDMAMVLINYVYFSGAWEKPFDGNLTKTLDFHVDETTTVQVPMMKRTGRFDFYQDADNHTTVIMLPYKGNTSMMIVLPDEGRMMEVEDYINKDYLKHWHDSLFRTSVDLYLPRFHISAEAPLDTPLKEMGMTNAFGDNADFSGISEDVMLKVSKVSHKAVLTVNEVGTKAAAATTIEIMPMSLPETMKLDRPFLLFILEDSTKSILFMGKINNPEA